MDRSVDSDPARFGVVLDYPRRRSADASVFAGLRRERVIVHPVDTRVGVRAGQLLGSVRAGSELAVDAFVVAAADVAGGAVVATVDTRHMNKLARHCTGVVVAPLDP